MTSLFSSIICVSILCVAALWLWLRVLLFVSERWDIITLQLNTITFTIRLHQILLVLASAACLIFAAPGAFFAISMGTSFSGTSSEATPFLAALLGFTLYMLAALILNFPGFPLHVHQRWFTRVHLVLTPSLLMLLVEPVVFLIFLAWILVFSGFWALHLRDLRLYQCPIND